MSALSIIYKMIGSFAIVIYSFVDQQQYDSIQQTIESVINVVDKLAVVFVLFIRQMNNCNIVRQYNFCSLIYFICVTQIHLSVQLCVSLYK